MNKSSKVYIEQTGLYTHTVLAETQEAIDKYIDKNYHKYCSIRKIFVDNMYGIECVSYKIKIGE